LQLQVALPNSVAVSKPYTYRQITKNYVWFDRTLNFLCYLSHIKFLDFEISMLLNHKIVQHTENYDVCPIKRIKCYLTWCVKF
jgi:hypothetical protein